MEQTTRSPADPTARITALLEVLAYQQSGRHQSIEAYLEGLYRAHAERNPEDTTSSKETANGQASPLLPDRQLYLRQAGGAGLQMRAVRVPFPRWHCPAVRGVRPRQPRAAVCSAGTRSG